MTDEPKEGKGAITVTLGKEVDRSLAEIVTALLKPLATELGGILGDSAGLINDRIRRKRERNAQLGLDEVRKKLEVADVEMKDISPPKEEELHLLVTGLSLADDKNLREMWAGLFANALDPNSDITAERPFLSLLQTLSPTDARIIDFLAFASRISEELDRRIKREDPRKLTNLSPEEKDEMQRKIVEHTELRDQAGKDIEGKAEAYGLNALQGPGWSENLMRQGIIENAAVIHRPSRGRLRLSSLDESRILEAFEQVSSHIDYLDKKSQLSSMSPTHLVGNSRLNGQIHLAVRLTPFGKRFATACGLFEP